MTGAWPPDSARFVLRRGCSDYPEQLEHTADPPEVLRGYGDPASLRPGLAAIGARKATPYGLAAARHFVGWAAGAGCVIVSGAAIGCDQAAHQAALDAHGKTVAVLGSGADIAYPRGAAVLLAQIVSSGGAVVSELDWGRPPERWTFVARNRIIAGLSMVLLVLEAGLGSGTFITADAALASGRDVLVVPGSIFAPECAGANRLLRQGARPVTDVSELRDELASSLDGFDAGIVDSPLIQGDDRVLAAVRTNPTRPDDLSRLLAIDIVTISRRLGRLETSGLIARYADGRYGPC